MLTPRQQHIMNIIVELEQASISTIKSKLSDNISTPTLNRDLAPLVTNGFLIKVGKGRSIAYYIAPSYKLFMPLAIEDYFIQELDQRNAQTAFNQDILSLLQDVTLFTEQEHNHLIHLKQEYQNNISDIPQTLYQKEIERLTIELSWKSAQIEGNTYSLLETERLFLEKEEAQGKPKEDALMLLNHKDTLDYLLRYKDIAQSLNISILEDIHSILIKDLGVGRNIRSRTVGITGTPYTPLDNAYQIREALEKTCIIINAKENGFEKALLAIAMISYIQPFEDGNKRTGRMIGNALLIADDICPLSYRSVEALDYKKAMLLFYEQNNLSVFKEIFIEQIEFSVKNYFR